MRARRQRRTSRGGGGRARRAARITAALLVLGVGIAIAWVARSWPDVGALARDRPVTTAFIERWRAQELAAGRPGRASWTWVPYERISAHLKRAVLVAEDINFFSHRGFDFSEMRVALADAIEERELPRGASTITQQLAKNLWLSPSRNPLRKIEEAILTWRLERALSKHRILEIYLNVVELGPGVFGAESAARRFFGKSADELTDVEAARLAASLPKPSSWHAGARSRTAERRAEMILRRMDKAQFLRREFP